MMTQLLASCLSSSGLKLGACLDLVAWFLDEFEVGKPAAGMVELIFKVCWWLVNTGYAMGDVRHMAATGRLNPS